MGEATNQIEAHIENTRVSLGSDLQELEKKVKAVTDWKQHFQKSPMTMIGVAFGGGILLATILGGQKSRHTRAFATSAPSAEPHAGSDHLTYKALETWDNIKGALIGVAATRFKDFVEEIIPGFHEQFQRAEEKAKSAQTGAD